MDTALPQKFPFILDRNLAKANCTETRVCTSCDIEFFGEHVTKFRRIVKKIYIFLSYFSRIRFFSHLLY